MEIMEYLRRSRARVLLVILLPFLGAVAAALPRRDAPVQYAGSVVYTPPLAVVRQAPQYVGSFGVAITSEPVVAAVAKATGESPANLVSGLAATSAAAASVSMRVTYTSTNATQASAVPAIAARLAAIRVAAPDLATLKIRADQTKKALADAEKQHTAFITSAGIPLPLEALRAKGNEVSQLSVQYAAASSAGFASAKGLKTALDKATVELASLQKLAASDQAMQDALGVLRGDAGDASRALADATAVIDASAQSTSITAQPTVVVSATNDLVRWGAIGAGVGLAAGFVLLVIMNLLFPPRARSGRSNRRRRVFDRDDHVEFDADPDLRYDLSGSAISLTDLERERVGASD